MCLCSAGPRIGLVTLGIVLMGINNCVYIELGNPPSVKYILLIISRRYSFCGSFMLFLSCVCCAFVCVFLLMTCGHLLGKG